MTDPADTMVSRQRERRAGNLDALAANGDGETLAVRCECGRRDCVVTIEVPVGELRHLSENGPGRLVVMRAHCLHSHDRVVRREEGYDVIRSLSP